MKLTEKEIDKPLTEQEWFSLVVLATNAAGEARIEGNQQAAEYHTRLAARCDARYVAVKQGRVMP